MWALVVVVVAPIGEDHSRLAQGVDQLSIKTLCPEATVEALGISVLPGATGINVESLDVVYPQPLLDDLGNELRPIVRAYVFRRPMLLDSFLQDGQHIGCFDCQIRVDAVTLTRKRIDQVERA